MAEVQAILVEDIDAPNLPAGAYQIVSRDGSAAGVWVSC